jgi:hypothetical protein
MQLSNSKKINYIYILLPIIVFFIYGYNLFSTNQNLDSLCDEGYLFLMIQAAHNGIHDGFSQWPTIIDVVFGNKISSNILYLRYTRFFIHLLSVSLFCFTTNLYLTKKGFLKSFENKLFFITTIYLLGAISFSSIAIAYNTLQEFFLLAVLGSYLISNVCDSKHINIYYSLIGFFSFFSILNVLPSGILVTLTVILMTFIKNSKDWNKSKVSIFWTSLGMFVAIVIYHYSFLSLDIVYENMSITFNSVKKWGAGYDSKSFLINIFIYFRDLFMGLSLLFGAVVFSYFVSKFLGKWCGFLILISSMILFSVYQIKPQLPLSTFLAFPLVMLIMLKLSATKKNNIKKLFSFEFIFYLFLFILPLLSTIGTNLYLGSKIILFILPWGVLFVELIEDFELNVFYKLETKLIRFLFIGILLLYSVIQIINNVSSKASNDIFFRQNSPISQIKLSNQQLTYFNKVDSIMKLYGYTSKEYVFSTQLDHMTLVALDATPHGIYFFPTMFLIDSQKRKERKPDFLFLDKYDLKLMGDSIKLLGWGFPQDYDSIYVGTPETLKMSYPTERTLYCLKKRKIIGK